MLSKPLLALAVTVLVAAIPAQDRPPPDPYTGGDPARMQALGCVSYGPFAIADHSTADVEEILGVPIRWLETAHFKIGSTLPRYKVADEPAQAAKLRRELLHLRRRLPDLRVPRRPRRLDPWLRVHLFAQRLEGLYADLRGKLGVVDEDFPESREHAHGRKPFMGLGPYLGMPEKYVVLLFEKEASCSRYLRRFTGGKDAHFGQRYHFAGRCLLFATAAEFADGRLYDDTNLHCHVAFNVVTNLLDGYRSFAHALPAWWEAGVSQWYLRRIDPRWNNFNEAKDGKVETTRVTDWATYVKALVRHGSCRPVREMLEQLDYGGWTATDHMLAWSRASFLLSRGDEAFATFANVLKDPFPHPGGAQPTRDQLLTRQREALDEAYGLDPDSFDRAWSTWVLRRQAPGR